MLSQITTLVAIAEPDFLLYILGDPVFTVFLLLIMILLIIHILISSLEARFNNKLQDLRSDIDRLERLLKEARELNEKNRREIDSMRRDGLGKTLLYSKNKTRKR